MSFKYQKLILAVGQVAGKISFFFLEEIMKKNSEVRYLVIKEFTLKSVVDFMEASGFHVREAQEIGEGFDTLPLGGKTVALGNGTVRLEGKLGAIRLEITPKAKANP
jgi:DUF1009 family protein